MEKTKHPEIALLILAAGEGSRMGEPKQLLRIDDLPLLDWQIKKWTNLEECEVFVVLGAFAPLVLLELTAENVEWVLNENWKTGMGSSIQAGLRHAMEKMDIPQGCLIVLQDQVRIEEKHLNLILSKARLNPGCIVSSAYDDQAGVPAFFPASFFDDLLSMEPTHGAGSLIRKQKEKVITVEIPEAEYDLDTKEDYLKFLRWKSDLDKEGKDIT